MRHVFAGLLTAAAVAAAGCGYGDGSNPSNFVPVSGKLVGAGGKALPWVLVGFEPTERGGAAASAQTGADGKFTVKSLGNEPGMAPGTYKVTVEPVRGKAGAPKLSPKLADSAGTTLTVEVRRATPDLVIEVQ